MLKLRIPLAPVAKGRPRLGRGGHVFTPAKTREFENALRVFYRQFMTGREVLSCPVSLIARFYMPMPKRPKHKEPVGRPDLDNLLKPVKDAANEILWRDDSAVVEAYMRKAYDTQGLGARIEIEAWELDR